MLECKCKSTGHSIDTEQEATATNRNRKRNQERGAGNRQVRRIDQIRYPMTEVASLSAVPQSCRTPLLNVRVPGRFTHTRPQWGGHEPHRGNSTRGPPKTPRQQQKSFKDKKPGAQNQAEGIPPGDLQKPPATAKHFQGRKTRAHKTKPREFHQGTGKNPAATEKGFARNENGSKSLNMN